MSKLWSVPTTFGLFVSMSEIKFEHHCCFSVTLQSVPLISLKVKRKNPGTDFYTTQPHVTGTFCNTCDVFCPLVVRIQIYRVDDLCEPNKNLLELHYKVVNIFKTIFKINTTLVLRHA